MCKVSVVVIAYNIEKYIEKCLKSITDQTFENIEIIVVNDGSIDRTIEIINNESKKDMRIKLVNQNNQGISSSRYNGYKIATGEYVLFVDGDDWLDIDAIEKLYGCAKKMIWICYVLGTDILMTIKT